MTRSKSKAKAKRNATILASRQSPDDASIQSVLSSTTESLELSSSAAAAAAPKDRLSSMLPELLSKVFAFSGYGKPISGILLPHTRKNRYRSILIKNSKKLKALCDVIVRDPELGALIQTLCIRITRNLVWRKSTGQELVTFYRSLKKLEDFSVRGPLVDSILSHDITHTCFPCLHTMRIYTPFAQDQQQYGTPFHAATFSCVEHYPNLASLHLSVSPYYSDTCQGDDETVDESLEESGSEGGDVLEDQLMDGGEGTATVRSQRSRLKGSRKFDTSIGCPWDTSSAARLEQAAGAIRDLHVDAPFDDPRTLQLVQRFESVVGLSLIDCAEDGANFASFLTLYDRSNSIKRLDLGQEDAPWYGEPESIGWTRENDLSPGIARFTALESLVLGTDTFSSPLLFQHLRDPLPLRHLEFNCYHAPVDTADLKALFLPGPTRLTSLKSLGLDVVYPGAIGPRAEEVGYYVYPDMPSAELHPEWRDPEWIPRTFEHGEVERLVKIAEDSGVTVSGDACTALTVQRAIREEQLFVDEWIN